MLLPLRKNGQISFDYSQAQWALISSAVAIVRREPLCVIERDALRITADAYQHDLEQKRAAVPSPSTERKAWEKASKLVVELQNAFKRAAKLRRARIGDLEQGLLRVTEEMMAAVLGETPPPLETMEIMVKGKKEEVIVPFHMRRGSHIMTAGEVDAFLSQVNVQIDSKALGLRFGSKYLSHTGRLEPRVPYVQQILWLWTHCFGGKLELRVDSSSIPARVYGPTVDYLAAVADPVLKDAAPKPSGLRSIINRQKKFYAWLTDSGRQYGQIGPLALDRARWMERQRERRRA